MYVAGRGIRLPRPRPGTHHQGNDDIVFAVCLMLAILCLAGQVVSLINDSPRVEGNNITVDLQTEHPVQCGIRFATTRGSPLRDCKSMSLLCIDKILKMQCCNHSYSQAPTTPNR